MIICKNQDMIWRFGNRLSDDHRPGVEEGVPNTAPAITHYWISMLRTRFTRCVEAISIRPLRREAPSALFDINVQHLHSRILLDKADHLVEHLFSMPDGSADRGKPQGTTLP